MLENTVKFVREKYHVFLAVKTRCHTESKQQAMPRHLGSWKGLTENKGATQR